MRVPSLAIYTLAALSAGELGSFAHANPNPSSSTQGLNGASYGNYVVPVNPATPKPTAAIAAPETQAAPQFAPTVGVQTNTPTQLMTPATQTPEVQVKNFPQSVIPPTQTREVQRRTATRSSTPADLVVTATDVQIVGATEELQQIIRNTIKTRPGGGTSQSQLQGDVAAILNTGLFANAKVASYSNSAGLKVVYQVKPIIVDAFQLSGARVLTSAVANNLLKSQLGAEISPAALRQTGSVLDKWYKDNGYVLAQVVNVQPNRNGVVTVDVAEGIVGEINFRFVDQEGKLTKGRTQEDFLRRELKLKPGDVFRVDVARTDLQQLYNLGLFENADVSLEGDARKVDVTYELTEQPARAFNVGGGYSDNTGIYGTVSYKDQNLGGVNQQLGLNVQVGNYVQFEGNFTNPYRASNPDKLGYSVNAFRRRTLSSTFDDEVKLPNGDKVREGRLGGGVAVMRPVGDWEGSAGVNYARTSIRDREGNITPVDELGNSLSFSDQGIDDLVTVSAGLTRDQRNNPANPTQGSVLSFNTDQSIPIGNGNILMNRLRASYTQYVPVGLLGNDKADKQDVLAFNVQGGTVIGDLPPYEAFNLGGANSVRGYNSGDVASGRSFVLASAEYRFPILNPLSGVLFADFGSDLGSGDTVPGEPGVVRDKPGTGFGYGAGLRVRSPIGLIRADYGFNDQGESRLQFGIGQRF